MKRIIIAMLAAMAFLTSCEKYYYTEGTKIKQYTYNVTSKDWDKVEVMENGFNLMVQLDVPAITSSVVNKGDVMVSRQLKDNAGQIYWTPLPVVRAEAENFGLDDQILYSTYLDYEWTVSTVYVYFTATDFFVDPDPKYWPDMVLKVTVME